MRLIIQSVSGGYSPIRPLGKSCRQSDRIKRGRIHLICDSPLLRASGLNVSVEDACLYLVVAFDLHKQAVVSRLRESIGEGDLGGRRVSVH